MYKQEALDSLECFRSNTAHILGDNDEKVKTIETCIMLVRETEEVDVPDIKVGEWISTSKKLPEIDQPVLVWASGDYWLAELHLLDGELYWSFDDFDLSGEEFDDVIAWMPLPELYKGVRDE